MKRAAMHALAAALLLSASSCSYLEARARDAADIFSLGLGQGFGVKAQYGPGAIGLGAGFDLLAIRSAAFIGPYELGEADNRYSTSMLFFWGDNRSQFGGVAEARGKHVWAWETPLFSWDFPRSYNAGSLGDVHPAPAHHYTNFEVMAGVGLTVRAGVNPGEALDFLLGKGRFVGRDSP